MYFGSYFVVSYGKYGKCDGCEWAREATASIKGKRYCKKCKNEKYPKSSAEFQDSDATFRCRELDCEAENLTYKQCVVGSCCEAALNNDPRSDPRYYPVPLSEDDYLHQEHQLVNKIFERAREEKNSAIEKIDDAKDKLTDAKEEVRDLERDLANARKKVEKAEKAIQIEKRNQITAERFFEKVKKRVLIVTKAAVGASESDEPAAKKTKRNEDIEKPQCKVCFFPFDNDHPEAVIIPCGHKACFNCISNLPQKNCPSCRADFTDNNVYKVFN